MHLLSQKVEPSKAQGLHQTGPRCPYPSCHLCLFVARCQCSSCHPSLSVTRCPCPSCHPRLSVTRCPCPSCHPCLSVARCLPSRRRGRRHYDGAAGGGPYADSVGVCVLPRVNGNGHVPSGVGAGHGGGKRGGGDGQQMDSFLPMTTRLDENEDSDTKVRRTLSYTALHV